MTNSDGAEEEPKIVRAVAVTMRARRAFELLAREEAEYMQTVLDLLRSERLDEIYRVHGQRWKLRGWGSGGSAGGSGCHALKIEQGKGGGRVVVLALVPKPDSNAGVLVVNAFRRRHKGGRRYNLTNADLELLDDPLSDCYGELVALCNSSPIIGRRR